MWILYTVLDPDKGLQFDTLDNDLSFSVWINSEGNTHLLTREVAELPPLLRQWVPSTIQYYATKEELIQRVNAIGRVQDYHTSNEGIDEKDAIIQCLDKNIITEAEYDLIYPLIMEDGLYSQNN